MCHVLSALFYILLKIHGCSTCMYIYNIAPTSWHMIPYKDLPEHVNFSIKIFFSTHVLHTLLTFLCYFSTNNTCTKFFFFLSTRMNTSWVRSQLVTLRLFEKKNTVLVSPYSSLISLGIAGASTQCTCHKINTQTRCHRLDCDIYLWTIGVYFAMFTYMHLVINYLCITHAFELSDSTYLYHLYLIMHVIIVEHKSKLSSYLDNNAYLSRVVN